MSEEKGEKDKAGLVDKVVSRLVSRKLLVWATATIGLFVGDVPADQWVNICAIYIGTQAAIDAIGTFVRAKNGG